LYQTSEHRCRGEVPPTVGAGEQHNLRQVFFFFKETLMRNLIIDWISGLEATKPHHSPMDWDNWSLVTTGTHMVTTGTPLVSLASTSQWIASGFPVATSVQIT
jgi:hypothetical protein